jgi:hypothetical protein
MNWKHRMQRSLLFSLLGGVVASSIYGGLLYTTSSRLCREDVKPSEQLRLEPGPELPYTITLLA